MSDSCCQVQIDAGALEARQRRVLIFVLAINAVTFFMMITAASLSGSSSLLSGALDNFGDAVTYALSLAVIGATCAAKARVALFKLRHCGGCGCSNSMADIQHGNPNL